MSIRVLITEGTQGGCKQAIHLIEEISAETLLADQEYDTNHIIAYVVAVAKRNRKEQRITTFICIAAIFGGKRFPALEILARNCDTICQKHMFISGRSAKSLHYYLVHCFDIISCRHYLA